jgi:hypothetical protein
VKDLQYALNDVKAGKDPSAYIAKAAAYAKELDDLVAAPPVPVLVPVAAPVAGGTPIDPAVAAATPYTGKIVGGVEGTSVIDACVVDASAIVNGNASAYPGAALDLGWSGVIGKNSDEYVVFKYGEIVARENTGSGKTDTVAFAALAKRSPGIPIGIFRKTAASLAASNGVGPDIFGRVLRLVAA